MKIALIVDSPIISKMISLDLKGTGVDLHLIEDEENTLEHLKATPAHLILLANAQLNTILKSIKEEHLTIPGSNLPVPVIGIIRADDLDEQEMEYLYADKDSYCFMNTSNYEQHFMTKDQLGEATDLLKDNILCTILLYNSHPIGITLPNFINLKVTMSEPWAKGDTATGSTKPATLETGLEVQVPPFIEEGQMVKIDTRSREYVERGNE